MMKHEKIFQKIVDFYDENPDVVELYEYIDTEIYKEIILFLNDFNPDWRKNKELGGYAPEMILSIIEEFNDFMLEDDTPEDTQFIQWLTNIYEDIATRYASTKSSFQLARFISKSPDDFKNFKENYIDLSMTGICTSEEIQNAYENQEKEDDEDVYLFF